MRSHPILALIAAIVGLVGCAPTHADRFMIPFTGSKAPLASPIHLVLGSDSHDSLDLIDRFVDQVNELKPKLVLHTGDFQQYGSPGEWRAVTARWKRLRVPLAATPGNHDHRKDSLRRLSALFGPAPRSFDLDGMHVVLLDDGAYRLGDQLSFLQRDLALHEHQRTLVAMHVPLRIPPQLGWMKALQYLPSWHHEQDHPEDHLALPEPDSDRLEALLKRYHVDALICGHQHVLVLDTDPKRTPALNLGTIGGYLPAMGEFHGYLTATVTDRGIDLERHALDRPPGGPLAMINSWRHYDDIAHALKVGKPVPK